MNFLLLKEDGVLMFYMHNYNMYISSPTFFKSPFTMYTIYPVLLYVCNLSVCMYSTWIQVHVLLFVCCYKSFGQNLIYWFWPQEMVNSYRHHLTQISHIRLYMLVKFASTVFVAQRNGQTNMTLFVFMVFITEISVVVVGTN